MTDLILAAPRPAGGRVLQLAAPAAGLRTPAAEGDDPAAGGYLQVCKELTAGVFDRSAGSCSRRCREARRAG